MPRRRHVGPRGAVTWPCVPRRIHMGPARKYPLFSPILNHFNHLEIEINSEKIWKNP